MFSDLKAFVSPKEIEGYMLLIWYDELWGDFASIYNSPHIQSIGREYSSKEVPWVELSFTICKGAEKLKELKNAAYILLRFTLQPSYKNYGIMKALSI